MSPDKHPAVLGLGSGVSSVDLADFIGQLAERARRRVITIGESQYGGQIQKFETLSPEKIFDELLDEVADGIAYLAMASIHAMAIRNQSGRVRGDAE